MLHDLYGRTVEAMADRPRRRGSRSAVLGAGVSVALVMTFALADAGRPLDEPAITGLAIVGGSVIGAWLLRPERSRAEGFET